MKITKKKNNKMILAKLDSSCTRRVRFFISIGGWKKRSNGTCRGGALERSGLGASEDRSDGVCLATGVGFGL